MSKTVLAADFAKILSACGRDVSVVGKRQIAYLSTYLRAVGAKTAVIEKDYVDRDFLEDHVRYYSRCFHEYSRMCHRVHFFAHEYSEQEIDEFLVDAEAEKQRAFSDAYLGFVVIRPLPQTVVGRTCLVPYEEDRTHRHYMALREVPVSFFGRKLVVRCMPFQEQDSAVAACATCALWSSFQITAALFGHEIYSPGRITSLATEHGLSNVRVLPNKDGLSVSDMVYAVRHIGLDPVCINVGNGKPRFAEEVMLGNIYAYLRLGVSVVVLGKLVDASETDCGFHAITVNGYHLPDDGSADMASDQLVANRIDKIYVHDDQLGPYARMEKCLDGSNEWITQWQDSSGKGEHLKFKPSVLLIPVYHKIRVSYAEVSHMAFVFGRLIKGVVYALGCRLVFEWDILLARSNDVKDGVREDADIPREKRLAFLETSFPRFIWKVEVKINGEKCAMFCIDATDSGQGLDVVSAIFYSQDLPRIVVEVPATATAIENPIFRSCIVGS